LVQRDASGNFSAGTITASLSGNATTATTLQTARNINGTSFNGSANITTASWGTARTINGTSVDGSTNYAIGRIYDTNYRRITNPGGGEYVTSTATVTGAIAVTLPVGMTGTMLSVAIKVYDYTTNESFEVSVGGYNYSVGNTWANAPYAYIIGNPGVDRRFNVRLGYNSTSGKAIVYIGELASTWSYPQVFVTEVQAGFSGTQVGYTDGWSIGFEASAFQNVTATISNCQVGYAVSTNTANAVVLRDASGNFSAGTITATLSGNATNVTGTVAIANGGTGATTAANARTNLGGTTLGGNLFTITNPSAVTFPRFNADNTVSALDAATFRTAIGAGTGGGSVTSVSGTGTVNGLTLSGTVTSSGSLTLSGAISGVPNTATTATSANTASAIVARDASGNFSAGTITASLSGTATTATTANALNTGNSYTVAALTVSAATAYVVANRTSSSSGQVGYNWAQGGANLWWNYLDTNGTTLAWYNSVTSTQVMTLTTGGALSAASFNGAGTGLTGTASGLSIGGNAANVTGTVAVANGGTGATTAANARTNLGATTVGGNYFTLTNPNAVTFPRMNADNTVSALDASTFRAAIGVSSFSNAKALYFGSF
jgi:hypothetical protein